MQITDRDIREYLGHNGVECRVRVCRDFGVLRYGSPDPTDRSRDYWEWIGTRADLAQDIRVQQAFAPSEPPEEPSRS
jgi:hypothetical protein